ncbi:MAG: glycine zipper domain-containing protein [Chthoniobacterales bacterium]
MNPKLFLGATAALLFLSACDTPVGQGAGYGAAGGAIIGGAAGGTVRTAAIGAAAGAGLGALIGAIVQDSERDRYYRNAPSGGYPVAEPSGYPGLVRSPYYPNNLVDVRGIPRGALVIDPSVNRPFVRP